MRVIFAIILMAGAYLLGGISTGMWVSSRFGGIDIRKHGSGSSGATNVLRMLGLKPGLTTFAGDFLKGLLAALVGRILCGLMGLTPAAGAALLGICAIAGHVFPAQSGFRGGKGVATCAGVFLLVTPFIGFLTIVVGLLCIALTRFVSLGSLAGAAMYFITASIKGFASRQSWLFLFALAAAAIVVYAHRENIERLRAGTESKIDFGKLK